MFELFMKKTENAVTDEAFDAKFENLITDDPYGVSLALIPGFKRDIMRTIKAEEKFLAIRVEIDNGGIHVSVSSLPKIGEDLKMLSATVHKRVTLLHERYGIEKYLKSVSVNGSAA